jgi:hypothetical protein
MALRPGASPRKSKTDLGEVARAGSRNQKSEPGSVSSARAEKLDPGGATAGSGFPTETNEVERKI